MKNDESKLNGKDRTKCEVYSRIVGYMKPVNNWNDSKKEEFAEREYLKIKTKKELK